MHVCKLAFVKRYVDVLLVLDHQYLTYWYLVMITVHTYTRCEGIGIPHRSYLLMAVCLAAWPALAAVCLAAWSAVQVLGHESEALRHLSLSD